MKENIPLANIIEKYEILRNKISKKQVDPV